MDKFDWRLTIRRNIIMLKIAGLWPAENETYKFNLYTIYAAISISAFVYGHNFFQSFNIIFILDDLQALTATIFISLTDLLGILKSYYLIQNMKTLKQLMTTLRSDMFLPRNIRQRKMIEPSINFWKMVYTFYSVMALSATFFFSTFPVLDKSVKVHRLPFLAWYPYNTTVSPLYEVTYFYQVASVSFISIINLNIDTLIGAINMIIGAQCDILCDDLRHLQELSDDINEGLRKCVEHHRAILRFAEESNRIFNWIFLAQFFVSAVSIGMTMFLLTVVAAFSSEFYSYLFYGNAVVVEIFMYCWFGNEVELKSSKIAYSVFESDWTEISPQVKKHLMIFVLRNKKPIRVSALNLFYLSLETFVKILRTAWSYFAILNQVNGQK